MKNILITGGSGLLALKMLSNYIMQMSRAFINVIGVAIRVIKSIENEKSNW